MNKFVNCWLLAILLLATLTVNAVRIKDITSIAGIRSNQLVGYGLVVGLDGTGDKNKFTTQSFKTMLAHLGVQLPANVEATSKNIAAVVIHAELPPFAQPGQRIDITVSSIGDCKSLRGGTLLLSPLKAADGNVYALAQGNLAVGGFGVEGADGSKIKVNVPVVGRIPNGATIELAGPNTLINSDVIKFLLHRADFTTARRLADVINEFMGFGTAKPIDAATVQVNAPSGKSQRVRFISALENLSLQPGQQSAKIIINSRTGTIVIGKNVTVTPAAVSHGSLTVTIAEDKEVNQPLPGADGETVEIAQSNVFVNQPNSKMFLFSPGVSLRNVVDAVNSIGASPGDLMAILEALKQAGALNAEIEII